MKKKNNILIVEDEETLSEMIKDLLEAKGYDVTVANNGVEGLKILTEEQIDLVVLDVMMPRMDGYMFMEHLKKRLQAEGIEASMPKIIVMTAIDKKTDFGRSKNLGASEFISKPFKNEDFIAAVKKLLA